MQVLNVHEREFPVSPDRLGELIDSLASEDDALWPGHSWPAMEFDRPLGVGAVGGHGPIRYSVEEYRAGESVRFCFREPKGFDGVHFFEIVTLDDGLPKLRHTIEMKTRGLASPLWVLVIRHLHDALIEDAFATAEASLGLAPQMRPWSVRVRFLRWMMSGGKRRPQVRPTVIRSC
jgi:hypothetical protein